MDRDGRARRADWPRCRSSPPDLPAVGARRARGTRLSVAALLGALARGVEPGRADRRRLAPADRRSGGGASERLAVAGRTRIADGRPERVAEILAEHGLTLEQWRAGLGDVIGVPGEPLPGVGAGRADPARSGAAPSRDPHPVPRSARGRRRRDCPTGWTPTSPGVSTRASGIGWPPPPATSTLGRLRTDRRDGPPRPGSRPRPATTRGQRTAADAGRRRAGHRTTRSSPPTRAATGRRCGPRIPWSARLLATVWRQWRETTAELCRRIAADLPEVCPGAEVARIELSAGDQHCGGRGVARLRLSDGTSVFLKPRSDGLHRSARRPCWIGSTRPGHRSGSALRTAFRTSSSAMGTRGYGRSRSADCPRRAPVSTPTSGGPARLLRVLQAMGATDLHHENFIPTTHLPVLVDLETAVGPGPRCARQQPDDAVPARGCRTPPGRQAWSPASSPVPRAGRGRHRRTGRSGRDRATPYAVRMLVPDDRRARSCAAPAHRWSTAAPCRRAPGEPVALRGHEQALIDGYADAQRRLEPHTAWPPTAPPTSALEPNPRPRGPVRGPADPDLRPPAAQSTAPAALVDGVEREFVLELLYRADRHRPAGPDRLRGRRRCASSTCRCSPSRSTGPTWSATAGWSSRTPSPRHPTTRTRDRLRAVGDPRLITSTTCARRCSRWTRTAVRGPVGPRPASETESKSASAGTSDADRPVGPR